MVQFTKCTHLKKCKANISDLKDESIEQLNLTGGTWENGKLNGYAVIYYTDGSIYQKGIITDYKFLYTKKKN